MKDVMNEVIEVGNLIKKQSWNSPQRGRIYSSLGVSPSMDTCGGGDRNVKIILYERRDHLPE